MNRRASEAMQKCIENTKVGTAGLKLVLVHIKTLDLHVIIHVAEQSTSFATERGVQQHADCTMLELQSKNERELSRSSEPGVEALLYRPLRVQSQEQAPTGMPAAIPILFHPCQQSD